MVGAEDSGACFKISSSGTWVHIKYTILSLATFYLSNMLNLLMDLKAKLGEQNKFYYDEKLKRWVEEGAEVPAEEPPLPPPPTKSSFQNSIPESNLNGPPVGGGYTAYGFAEAKALNPSEPSSGMPPMPPTQNQFSARGRMGVRSR